MSRAALIAIVVAACSSDPRDRRYEQAVADLDKWSAAPLVDLCCPYPWTPEHVRPGYMPACISLNAELLAWRDLDFATRAFQGFWDAGCREHVPADTLILGLARTDDHNFALRGQLLSKLAEYAPTPRIIAAFLRELRRPGNRFGAMGAASLPLGELAEVDLDLVVDALADPSPKMRTEVLAALFHATEHRLEMPRLEEALSRVASRDPDVGIRRYATHVVERYRQAQQIPVEDAIAHLIEQPGSNLPLIGRRRIGCGSAKVAKLLQEAAADLRRYQERQAALLVLEHRARYCRGYENLHNPDPERPKPPP